MTVSRCFQLILYGIIAGYEIPRMVSRFTVQPEPDEPIVTRKMPDWQCDPGSEMEAIN